MDIGSLLLGLALLLVIAFIVARPLLEQTGVREQPASPADHLLAHREQVLTQLRDLDFDQATGKINQEDYSAQRAQLVAEGVAILKQLDSLGIEAGQSAPLSVSPSPVVAEAPADEIEAAVAQLRARRASAGQLASVSVSPSAAVAVAPADEIEAAVAQLRAHRASAARPAPTRAAIEARNLDDEIEATVAERQAAGAARQPADAKLACAQCGAEVLPNDSFCPKCGSALTIACGNCGRVARVGDQFCAHCGQPLSVPAAPGQPVHQAGAQS